MLNKMKPILSIQRGALSLRPLDYGDLNDTLEWRNRDGVRQWFFYDQTISLYEHLSWYKKYLEKNDDVVLIGEVMGGKVGQLAVYNITEQKAEVGRFIVSPSFSGTGLMRDLIILLCESCKINGLKELYLDVLKSNERAIRLYESIGFVIVSSTTSSIKMTKVLE